MKKILTLCIIHNHPQILLGMKKYGFGKGKWNGFGGKVKKGESLEETAKREIKEECGIKVNDLVKMGLIDFEFQGNPEILEVHIFKTSRFEDEPKESDEMKPQWFHVNEIPFNEMWPDDRHWMPLFLEGKKFRGKFLFEGDDKNPKILEVDLVETEEI